MLRMIERNTSGRYKAFRVCWSAGSKRKSQSNTRGRSIRADYLHLPVTVSSLETRSNLGCLNMCGILHRLRYTHSTRASFQYGENKVRALLLSSYLAPIHLPLTKHDKANTQTGLELLSHSMVSREVCPIRMAKLSAYGSPSASASYVSPCPRQSRPADHDPRPPDPRPARGPL